MKIETEELQQKAERLDCIQLLRAFAAIAVVTHHIPLFGNGAWGVDLFFVISGFIVCYVTEHSDEGFFTKRIIRIVPLYWFGTIGVFFLALLMPHVFKNTVASLPDLFRSLAFIPFQKGELVQPMLYLGWTLNYEVFFYTLFATSMAISHRYRVFVCSLLIVLVVVVGQVWPIKSVAFEFLTNSIILEFAFGMLCHSIFRKLTAYREESLLISSRVVWTSLGVALIDCLSALVRFDGAQ